MDGNSTFRHVNTSVLSTVAAEAPVVVTSAELDDQLAPAYERLGLRPGLLEGLAGIHERRWWPDGVTFVDGAVMAGAKALAQAGIDTSQIGLMINSSVSRAHLEPSTAVEIHHKREPPSAMNFDIANACLGFVNGIHIAATMIDAGHIDYALIVNGEDAKPVQLNTIARLCDPSASTADFFSEFATLTLGSGAAAMVLGRSDIHSEGHRVVGGLSRAGTEHHQLCVGDITACVPMPADSWTLDSNSLKRRGSLPKSLTGRTAIGSSFTRCPESTRVHCASYCGIDQKKVPLSFPEFGNIGPASLPFTLAHEVDNLLPGDRVLCMGIGSGLNTAFCEIAW